MGISESLEDGFTGGVKVATRREFRCVEDFLAEGAPLPRITRLLQHLKISCGSIYPRSVIH